MPTPGSCTATAASVPSGEYAGSVSVQSGGDRVTVPVRYSAQPATATTRRCFARRPAPVRVLAAGRLERCRLHSLPRIHVFDATAASPGTASLPPLGVIKLADYPTCRLQTISGECHRPMMNIAADGKTLFVAGDVKLLVVPVP